MLAGGVFAWVQTLRALEFEPRAVLAAQQIAGLVNVARAALQQTDGINRVALLKSLADKSGVTVRPQEPGDRWERYERNRYSQRVAAELRRVLGDDVAVAARVNDQAGLWVGFPIERDRYWLRTATGWGDQPQAQSWGVWIAIALFATLAGSAAVARLINRPLRDLSSAASRISQGDLESRLDENALTSEIREVNMGFNRMARELSRVEEDRTVMLAGISHDLRTPLARLRLEAEMSVSDEEAKRNMALDIDQLDAIIDKFLDYARPGETHVRPVDLDSLVEREAASFRDESQLRIRSRLAPDLGVLADETELGRVFANLFENARRYGRSPDTQIADVEIGYTRMGPWVVVSVRDHGPGVPAEKLAELATPFFRGDTARTAATGAGLGLAIVDKAMQRMGGTLELTNAPDGGLVANLRLKRAP